MLAADAVAVCDLGHRAPVCRLVKEFPDLAYLILGEVPPWFRGAAAGAMGRGGHVLTPAPGDQVRRVAAESMGAHSRLARTVAQRLIVALVIYLDAGFSRAVLLLPRQDVRERQTPFSMDCPYPLPFTGPVHIWHASGPPERSVYDSIRVQSSPWMTRSASGSPCRCQRL